MENEYLFLDTNIFIDYKNDMTKLEEILKYSEKKGWKLSISMYTLLELKSNEKLIPIINFLCENFSRISIIQTEIKGMNRNLFEFKSIKKIGNEECYKKEKKSYEMKCVIYFCAHMAIIFQEIFDSNKIFSRKFKDLKKYKNLKDKNEDNDFINEYLEKIVKEILLFYNGTLEVDKRIKQKIKSKRESMKKELIIETQNSGIKNQSNFMIKLTIEVYLEMVYKKIFNIKENIDKNNFLDILFIGLVDTKQMLMTRDKWILEKIKSYGYSEIEKYNIYSLMGVQKLNVFRQQRPL
jgi:hypothetical protein|nr:MAG TPA: PIN domain [Caudoviricetes sp.]